MGRLLIWSAATVLVLAVALVVATPWLVRAAVPEVFARFGLEASAGGGRLNLLRAEITVEDFVLGARDAPALSLDELGVGIGLRALAGGRIALERLRVAGVDVNTERLMDLWKRVGADARHGSGRVPVALDDLELVDVRLVSVGERIGHDVRIARLAISDPGALARRGVSRVALQGAVGEGSVDLSLEMSYDGNALKGAGTYRLERMPLAGWARLGDAGVDPLASGSVSGRGHVNVGYATADDALDLMLDGPVRVAGLAFATTPVDAGGGDAAWRGRLALHWTPAMTAPSVRGDGALEVEALQLTLAPSDRPRVRADFTDVSLHGEFDWSDAFVMEVGVAGTRLALRDGSDGNGSWQSRAENFSMRVRTHPRNDAGTLGLTVDDLDVSRLDAAVGDAPVDVSVAKITVDELRTTRSGGLALGVASADTVSVTARKGGGAPRAFEVYGLAAQGMSGNADGALHVASVKAESAQYSDEQAKRTLRLEGVDLASLGLGTSGLMGADQALVASARVQAPSVDVWVSGVEVDRVHGDGGGRFGAGRVSVERMFQSSIEDVSWQASGLVVDEIDGGIDVATRIAKVALASLSMDVGGGSWDAAGFHAAGLAVTPAGAVDATRLGLEVLERREPSEGALRVAGLEGEGLGVEDMRASLHSVTSKTIEYRWPNGVAMALEGVTARDLSGDRASGVTVERLALERASGRAVDGARLAGAALETRALVLAADGELNVGTLGLASLTAALPGGLEVKIDGAEAAALRRAPAGALSVREASLADARLVESEGAIWALTRLAASDLAWQVADGVGVGDATLESLGRTRAEAQPLLAKALRVTKLALRSPSDVAVAGFAAGSIEGGSGALAWKVESVDAEAFEMRRGAGETLERLGVAGIRVDDARNGAELSVENTRVRGLQLSALETLAIASASAGTVRIASRKPDWPSRLTLAGVRVENATLDAGGAIDVHEIVAREPYLIVAQLPDNTWMWPPLPGGGARRHASGGGAGLRIARFATRGPARAVYIDRGTEPAFRMAIDPLVVAFENLDTRLPGSKTRFRAHGTGTQLSDIRVNGTLTRRVDSFDLDLGLDTKGLFAPHFNPYVALREPISVSAGWGDIRGKVVVADHRLGGNMSVLLSGLEIMIKGHVPLLARLDPADFPLRTALALLKDAQGNIHVEVPLQAQTATEGFDVIDTFRAAFARSVLAAGDVARNLPGKTMEDALEVIERTLSLLPGIDTESYSPIVFSAGSDDVGAESRVYLGQLAGRLDEHPELALALCGRAVPVDREALGAAVAPSSFDELFDAAAEGVYPTYDANKKSLLVLARARAGSVRRHLHDVHRIDDRRLAACDAKVETSAGEPPRVDLRVKTPAKSGGLLDFL